MRECRFAWMLVALACAVFVWGGPCAAYADLIPSTPESRALAEASPTECPVAQARQAVSDRLAAFGLPAADIESRLAELNEADIRALATAPEQFQVVGFTLKEMVVVLGIVLVMTAAAIIGVYYLHWDDNDRAREDVPLAPAPEPEPPV